MSRYSHGGGFTAAEQARREVVRMNAAEDFAAGMTYQQVARKHRVAKMSAWRWWKVWKAEGQQGLRSTGPASVCRLSDEQLRRLASLLDDGPAAHGYDTDPRWTLARVRALVAREFGVEYSLKGISLLLHRLGFSPQVPTHRAVERDDTAIATWIGESWARGKALRARGMRGSASRTNRARASARPRAEPGAGADIPR
ncbi:winged helix-turn-helix domain-containing protein [Nocardia sp. NPDC046763]|uniref:winged helix-turn-helix domain-containing protein n=1 Tax=Nocardia sp. NPDC046763 TaxID=3155256 RepID=UPI0033E1D06B